MEILTKFSNDLRILGYNANFRAKVIQSAIKGFRRQVEAAANGGPPINILGHIREKRGDTRSSPQGNHGLGHNVMLSASSRPRKGAGW